ncbi:hypothetical protein [Hydrogenimonas sp.]
MIHGLTPLHAAHRILSGLAKVEINALLQMGIKVLEKKGDGTFLIQLGRHTLQTKSEAPLIPGREYWVDMQQGKEGAIRLTKLHPKPLLLEKEGFVPLGRDFLSNLSAEEDPAGGAKERLMQMMASAQSKEQFHTLGQLLLSLHQGVLTIPIEERGKRMLLQMRRGKKNETLKQKSVEFYAAFNNLGPIEGAIVRQGEKSIVNMEVFYPKTAHLLNSFKEELSGFSRISVSLRTSPITPFWESDTLGLLDIRG